ncbi:MAG: multicopper oxidase domain-containing protein [Pseudomonadota bacterium]|nr:multicopper oxidase domain-containing protein [Pseudomonadota bacterium]
MQNHSQLGIRFCLLVVVALQSGMSMAQQAEQAPVFSPPPLLPAQGAAMQAKRAGGMAESVRAGTNLLSLGAERDAIREGRQEQYILPIKYTVGKIFNPATGKLDTVRLRSYGDRFVAPTINMAPGQTVRIGLQNQLPAEPNCGVGQDVNVPHCFNTTNLHSHGLWVSPTGNSDNVLLSLYPGVSFEYEYNVPDDHPAGTFWYHPHRHGSTSMQVGSGMAGMLIIRGDRLPKADGSNGDLDVLLKPFAPRNRDDYSEEMLIQQIPYACFDDAGNIEVDPISKRWVCKDGQVAKIEDFKKQMTGGVWAASGRYTSINGYVRPTLPMTPGRLYRWRFVHAGVRESILLRIRKIDDVSKLQATAGSSEERAAEVAKACTGTEVSLFEVAADGLTRSDIYPKNTLYLQSGYRSDVVFSLPETGSYCVFDDGATAVGSISAAPENPKVLAIIQANGGRPVADQKAFMQSELLRSAGSFPNDVRDEIIRDVRNMRLTRFVPHRSIDKAEIDRSGLAEISIDFKIDGNRFMVNGEPFKPDRMDQTLILHKAQAWRLTASTGSHPHHIHVNPFQIVSIRKKGADGKPTGPEITDGQYAGMLNTWKDTILVQSDVVIQTYTRYQRYIGQFVLHCHILDHEDQGMMQNVEVVLPDGKGGAAAKGHH